MTNHAITIDGARRTSGRGSCSSGWHRGGWYTYRWVDRLLFPANDPVRHRYPARFQDLQVGDRIHDGPPQSGCFFVVEALERPHRIVLRSRTHLPPFPNDRWLDWV